MRKRFGYPEEPREGFSRIVARGLDSYTYFARGTWVGRIKIGRSNDPRRRVNELYRTPCGEDAELVAVLRGASFETFYHRLFAEHLYGHEWFEPHADILAEIERINAGSEVLP